MSTSPALHPAAQPAAQSANFLGQLADFACSAQWEEVDGAARRHLRFIVADTLAACAVGNQEPEMQAMRALQMQLTGGGEAYILGTGLKMNPIDAAALNAAAGCWLELDEGNLTSNGHPGIQVIPAALAVAQQLGKSGAEFMLACAIGYEICARIGSACSMRMCIHPHGTYGVVGAAVAVGRLMGLAPPQMRELINLAGSSPMAGNRQGMKDGATLRNWYASHSAIMGQTAVRLVLSGFTGPHDGLTPTCDEVLFDDFKPDVLVKDLGERWLLSEGYIKLYGCGRPIHAAIDALRLALASTGDPSHWPLADDIQRIEIRGFKFLAFLNRRDIRNAFATRFSTPFAVASIIVNRSHGLECFDDAAAANETIQALVQRVELTEFPDYSERFPQQQLCDVRITLNNGNRLEGHCDIIRGEPANPADPQEYRDKFLGLMRRVWPGRPETKLAALYESLLDLERLGNMRDLADLSELGA